MRKLELLLSRAEEIIIGVLLLTASIILFVNVGARYAFNLGLPWAEEVVRYQIIWMVFLGGSAAARRGMHIGVDIIAKFSAPPIRTMVLATTNVIALGFCGYLAYHGVDLVSRTRMFGQVAPATQLPIWTVQLAIPVGCALMALRFGQQLYQVLVNGGPQSHLESVG